MPDANEKIREQTLTTRAEYELIVKCQAGDDAAFDALVEAIKHPAYALAFRWTQDRGHSFDILQEALIRLYGKLSTWNHSCRVQTWLYRVITNACIDRHRGQRFDVLPGNLAAADAPGAAERLADPARSPRESIEHEETAKTMENCLRRLPTKMQHVVRLRYLGGLSLLEISEVQRCSLGTIKATIFQGLRKLRLEMTRAAEEAP